MIHTVHVTEADIAEAIPRDCEHCPVARALTRTAQAVYPAALGVAVTVSSYGAIFQGGDWSGHVPLPGPVLERIKEYDAILGGMKPFTFELDFPEAPAGVDSCSR